ncbi:hypothetical protein B296_00029179 [Ensete ventricosum]|uniref:Uncharacterized protein n=1 Tax=Ensete ventricosum TaxID=4639 RepID=A0A426XLB3_ENSVE|nr:hypothetical protein B296_00029179 [Ensete ventricosum]
MRHRRFCVSVKLLASKRIEEPLMRFGGVTDRGMSMLSITTQHDSSEEIYLYRRLLTTVWLRFPLIDLLQLLQEFLKHLLLKAFHSAMRRGRAHASFVACLILVVAGVGLHGFARRVSGKQRYQREEDKRSSKESSAGVVTVGLSGSKSEKVGSCGYRARSEKKDSSVVEDDKRVVPTGSNRLHNK